MLSAIERYEKSLEEMTNKSTPKKDMVAAGIEWGKISALQDVKRKQVAKNTHDFLRIQIAENVL